MEDTETLVEDTLEPVIQEPQIISEEVSKEERDWRAFREKRKEEHAQLLEAQKLKKEAESKAERQALELEQMKHALTLALGEKNKEAEPEEEDYQKKFIASEVQRILNSEREAEKKKNSQDQAKKDYAYVQQNMPDLSDVCSQDNISFLEYFHPEIAIPLANMPDGLQKTELLYKAIKKHVKMNHKEKEKLDHKLSKPKASHASSSNESTQEKDTGVISDKRKKETWSLMNRLISGEEE